MPSELYTEDVGGTGTETATETFTELDECLVAGTLIVTPTGEVPIEDIKIGDTLYGGMYTQHNDCNIKNPLEYKF